MFNAPLVNLNECKSKWKIYPLISMKALFIRPTDEDDYDYEYEDYLNR